MPAGEVASLTAALRDCLTKDDSELEAMGKVGRLRVEERHDVRRSAKLLRDAFEPHA
jgi:hypothetical protein